MTFDDPRQLFSALSDPDLRWEALRDVPSACEEIPLAYWGFLDHLTLVSRLRQALEHLLESVDSGIEFGDESVEERVEIGFSRRTATLLVGCSLLRSAGVAALRLTGRSERWHTAAGTTPPLEAQLSTPGSLTPDLPESEMVPFLAHPSVRPGAKLSALGRLAELVISHGVLLNLSLLGNRFPSRMNARAASAQLAMAVGEIAQLAFYPEYFALIDTRTRETLARVRRSVAAEFADEFRRHVREWADAPPEPVAVIAPDVAAAVAGVDLVTGAFEVLEDAPGAMARYVVARDAYRSLMSRCDPMRFSRDERGRDRVADLVSAPENHDDWPGSLPESESLARSIVLAHLAQGKLEALHAREWLTLPVGEQGTWIIQVPAERPRRSGVSDDMLMQARESFPALTWLLLPSTLRDPRSDGFVTGAPVGTLDHSLEVLLSDHETRRRTRRMAAGFAEAAATAAGAAVFDALVAAFAPGLPAGGTRAVSATASLLLVKWAATVISPEAAG